MSSQRSVATTLRLVRCVLLIALLLSAAIAQPQTTYAHDALPHGSAVFDQVGFDQNLDGELPLGLFFRDENNQRVQLRQYFEDKPVVLALSYFECTTLCPLVRHGLVEALRPLAFKVGDEFDVVLVSIDPNETAANAKAVKQETLAEYGRVDSREGWHFLTSDHDTIDQLASAIGFRYAYDSEQDEYAHPSGLVLLTPVGKIARYFFGIEYVTKDLRLGLVEASHNRIGTAIDQLLLLCYHYEPVAGRYSLMIMNVMRLAALLTVSLIGLLLLVMWRKESRRAATFG